MNLRSQRKKAVYLHSQEMVNQLGDRTGTGTESGRIVKMLTAHSKTLTLSSLAHPVVFPTQFLDSPYYF